MGLGKVGMNRLWCMLWKNGLMCGWRKDFVGVNVFWIWVNGVWEVVFGVNGCEVFGKRC